MVDLRHVRKQMGTGDGRVTILEDVTLQVHPGELVALTGPSGSGKSTLLNILGCLDRPSGGEYRLGGSDVSSLTRVEQAWVRLHFIGFVFQSFNLLPRATALENVGLPLYYAGVPPDRRREIAASLLARVGLTDRATYLPSQLSGGQCQRVAIARALASRPGLLLADEPTGALDSRSGAEILSLLLELRRAQQLTIVLVTHDPGIAAQADRRIRLFDGRIVDGEGPS
jgi:ABC-type lipoprotein export system ATPase subunit